MTLAQDPKFEVRKSPTAKRTYGLDWLALGFLEAGETITSASWTITPSGPGHLQFASPAQNATQTGAEFTGGKVGQDYKATCHVVTTKGEDDRTITVKVRAR